MKTQLVVEYVGKNLNDPAYPHLSGERIPFELFADEYEKSPGWYGDLSDWRIVDDSAAEPRGDQ